MRRQGSRSSQSSGCRLGLSPLMRVVEETADKTLAPVGTTHRLQYWVVGIAHARNREITSGMERAPDRPVQRMWHRPLYRRKRLSRRIVQGWNAAQQSLGVRMLRGAEKFPDGCMFNHSPEVHDGDVVSHLGNHPQIVGDQHHSHPSFGLKAPEEVQNLCLGGNVERGRWFIGDEQPRITRKCKGNHRPLTQATGKLIGELVHASLGPRNTHHLQQFYCPVTGFTFLDDRVVDADGLNDLVSNGVNRAETRHRLLENERDIPSLD